MADNKFTLDDILNEYSSASRSGASSESLDEILKSYPATKNYEDSGLAEIFDSRRSTTDIDLSGINISMPDSYPTPEEIREADRAAAAKKQAEEDEIKRRKQIDYEIMSGDYDRKYMPDELKTSDELAAEQAEKAAKGDTAKKKEHHSEERKKVKVKPAKKKYGLDFADEIKGIRPADEEDDFDKKYGGAPLFTFDNSDSTVELTENHKLPFKEEPDSGMSFSEKLEHQAEFEEKYGEAMSYKKDDPFSGYAAIDDIDSILDQYDKKEKAKNTVKTDTSPLKGFTDIFNKLMAKEEESEQSSELLDGSKKIKKTVNGAAPIERKHISDIDLDLSDKILKDTTQINTEKTKAELEKLNELKERRSDKVKNFVLMGEEEETEEEAPEEEEIEDFCNISDAPSIASHIADQKNQLAGRLLVLIVCFAATAYMALANDFNLPVIEQFTLINKHLQPASFLFINSIIGVIAGFAAYQTVSNGMSKLFAMKADSDTLSALALISSLITSMVTITNTNMVRGSFVNVYVPVAIGALIFNCIGKLLIISRTQRSFSHISDDNEHYALFVVDDEEKAQNFTRGSLTDFPVLAGMQKTEVVSDFLKTSYANDSTDRFCRKVCPIIASAATVIAVLSGFMSRTDHGTLGAVCAGLSAFSAVSALCSCFAMMLVVNLPMNRASRKCGEKQGAVIGFDCIDEFCDTNSILCDAAQLFPAGSIKLINIKSFPDTSIDEAIVEAASLTSQSGSILKSMFYDIIVGKTEMLNPVESYIYEDSMGLCGWINNKRVLLGNRELMQNHSIEGLPSIAKEREYTDENRIAVYLSISGQLSSMFIIELTPAYQVKAALQELEKSGIAVMIRSVDSMLSVNRLSELFGVSPSMFRLIPFRQHPDYEKTTDYIASRPATLACSGRFAAFAQLILSAGRLRSTISVGIILQAAAMLLGILLTLTMVLLNSMSELSVTSVLAFNLAFVLIYIIFQQFKKL
ncbi:MAG: hypothetical protein ACI4Q6_07270 [Huintestinicola sp.]